MAIGINITHRGTDEGQKFLEMEAMALRAIDKCWWIPFKSVVKARVSTALREEWIAYDSQNAA